MFSKNRQQISTNMQVQRERCTTRGRLAFEARLTGQPHIYFRGSKPVSAAQTNSGTANFLTFSRPPTAEPSHPGLRIVSCTR
jgi:hypothetical protein